MTEETFLIANCPGILVFLFFYGILKTALKQFVFSQEKMIS